MIFVLGTLFHIYFYCGLTPIQQCLKCESASRRFQLGEGPSRGLFRACTTGCGTDGSICGTILDFWVISLNIPHFRMEFGHSG